MLIEQSDRLPSDVSFAFAGKDTHKSITRDNSIDIFFVTL